MYQQYVYQQINANDYKNVHNQKNLITQIVAFITCSLTLLHQKIFEWFIFVVKNDLNFSYCTWAVQHTMSKKLWNIKYFLPWLSPLGCVSLTANRINLSLIQSNYMRILLTYYCAIICHIGFYRRRQWQLGNISKMSIYDISCYSEQFAISC